jgi:hypothetical protein
MRENLSDQRRDGVAELPLHLGAPAVDLQSVRERLDAAELSECEAPVVPVEGANCGAGLRLDGP